MEPEHRSLNLENRNARTPVHASSPDYAVEALVADPERLSGVVAFDAPFLGDIGGLRVVHLQCHIGTDTLSLARLGADVTGLDFSEPALEVARDLFARCSTPRAYVAGDTSHITANATAEWSHGLGETVTALIDAGMRIDRVDEQFEIDWKAFEAMVATEGGRFRLPDELHGKVPLSFSIQSTRTGGSPT